MGGKHRVAPPRLRPQPFSRDSRIAPSYAPYTRTVLAHAHATAARRLPAGRSQAAGESRGARAWPAGRRSEPWCAGTARIVCAGDCAHDCAATRPRLRRGCAGIAFAAATSNRADWCLTYKRTDSRLMQSKISALPGSSLAFCTPSSSTVPKLSPHTHPQQREYSSTLGTLW